MNMYRMVNNTSTCVNTQTHTRKHTHTQASDLIAFCDKKDIGTDGTKPILKNLIHLRQILVHSGTQYLGNWLLESGLGDIFILKTI